MFMMYLSLFVISIVPIPSGHPDQVDTRLLDKLKPNSSYVYQYKRLSQHNTHTQPHLHYRKHLLWKCLPTWLLYHQSKQLLNMPGGALAGPSPGPGRPGFELAAVEARRNAGTWALDIKIVGCQSEWLVTRASRVLTSPSRPRREHMNKQRFVQKALHSNYCMSLVLRYIDVVVEILI